jgi:dihydroneopterin aldolase
MMQPTPLLETIAMELCSALIVFSPIIKKITLTIRKTALPIEGFQGSTAVRFTREK